MKLLSIQLKGSSNCDVIGYASENKSAVLLKQFKTHSKTVEGLVNSGALSTSSNSLCLVRTPTSAAGQFHHQLFVHCYESKPGLDHVNASERARRIGTAIYQKLSQEKIKEATLHVESFLHEGAFGEGFSLAELTQTLCEGLWLSSYKFKKYFSKTETGYSGVEKIIIHTESSKAAVEEALENARIVADCVYIARDLSNEPPNELYPETLCDDAKELAKHYGLKFKAWNEKDLAKEKAGLILGVGQGSVKPPRFFVLEYTPKKKGKYKTLALVGKGVTFDSGGISIKPGSRMEEMRHDMSGASTVLAATLAIARLQLPVRIVCAIAAVENMPDGNAITPGHILTGRNGKTVEVNNTDAEGRLILGDAIDFAQDYKPDYIIDAATLTGAIGIALGKVCGGLFGNSDELNDLLMEAGKISSEKLWTLPMYSEYFDELKSEYADMRNVGDSPNAGSIKGAMFIKEFIRPGMKWAHLDIASMAFENGVLPHNPRRGGTGWGVRLLVESARLIANK